MLAHNRRSMLASGVYYPKSITGFVGQHELPWAVKNWDLRLLNPSLTNCMVLDYLTNFVRDAVAAQANILLVSSEDFSLLSEHEWTQFFEAVSGAFTATNQTISECTITWTRRSVPDSAESSYATLVLLGLTYDFASIRKRLEWHFRHVYRQLSRLRTSEDFSLKRRSVRWSRRRFLKRWLERVMPQVESSRVKFPDAHVNVSRTLHDSESLAFDNRSRNVEFDTSDLFAWPRYHDERTIEIQRTSRELFFSDDRSLA